MEQQAWVLRNFLAQLESQEPVDEGEPNGILGEFARLRSQSTKFRTDKTYPSKTAEKQENIKRNRYKDIVPFDHSRVRLTLATTKNDTDYINANFIKGMSGSRAYIATQGPLPHTVLDFLRMLWEYNVQVVVMACREFEMGKKKCERYWPQREEQPFVCEPFTVYCDSEENKGDYLTRILRVTFHNCTRTLKQLHYVNWPDHGVPDSIPPILEMLDEMRSYQDHDDIPICIHCSYYRNIVSVGSTYKAPGSGLREDDVTEWNGDESVADPTYNTAPEGVHCYNNTLHKNAGCGRTGALCVIDYTWNLLKKQMITPDFSIYDLVQNMRTQRPSVVQTKEQYVLVYRTIKLLFQKYLQQSMDAHTCRDEVTMVPPPITPDSESDTEFDLLERDFLPQYHTTSPHAPENLIVFRAGDQYVDRQQWHLLCAFPDNALTGRDLQEGARTSPTQVHTSQRATAAEEEESRGESEDIPSLKPPPVPAMPEAICLMVEDPYFDTPVSSPSSEEVPLEPAENTKEWTFSPIFDTPLLCVNDQNLTSPVSDEEAPPPLPERTAASYELALDTERSHLSERLSVIIPPNAAAEAVRELRACTPSPVPPLPERTPESFELATNQAPVEQSFKAATPVDLSRIGLSSEWSGISAAAVTATQKEPKPWARSKSLKVKMNFTVPVAHFDVASNTTSNLHPLHPPPLPSAPPPLPSAPPLLPSTPPPLPSAPPPPLHFHTEDSSLIPPLPDRTPESFILRTEETHVTPASSPQPSPRVGSSSEWDVSSQSKKFLDVVMCRSKSVRVRSSGLEPLTNAQQLAPSPVVVAGAGSAPAGQHEQVNRRPSLNTETPGNKSDKGNERGMCRAKSLKFFRHKQKTKLTPLPPSNEPGTQPPTNGASFSLFKFGFGNRFGKPKGPRNYPETWISGAHPSLP